MSARACARSARAVRAHDSLATSRVGNGVVLALDQHAPFEPMTAWPPAASATAAACARSASPHELHWIVRHCHFDRFFTIPPLTIDERGRPPTRRQRRGSGTLYLGRRRAATETGRLCARRGGGYLGAQASKEHRVFACAVLCRFVSPIWC